MGVSLPSTSGHPKSPSINNFNLKIIINQFNERNLCILFKTRISMIAESLKIERGTVGRLCSTMSIPTVRSRSVRIRCNAVFLSGQKFAQCGIKIHYSADFSGKSTLQRISYRTSTSGKKLMSTNAKMP